MVNSSPATVCWDLLQMLIEQYEIPQLTHIHKVVSKKIISMGAFLPHWLLASYKVNIYFFDHEYIDSSASLICIFFQKRNKRNLHY